MKTIAITGATSPVGQAIADYFAKTYNVIRISRTTGYDLTNQLGYLKALNDIEHADVFINMANVGTTQTQLLIDVHNLWKCSNKAGRIISVGTLTTLASIDVVTALNVDLDMLGNKLLLDKTHNELSIKQPFGTQPESILIRFANFGVKTGNREGEPSTTPEQMIEVFNFVVESTSYISTIDFRTI